MLSFQGFGEQILAGAVTTLQVAFVSLAFGIVVGWYGALAKRSQNRGVRWAANGYTTVIRGVPELLLIL
ncbi:MAG: ABC transporter permease subunit, partial [Rhizobium pusense]|nr:ABC transporter permease subunit [Agrobacterium pusense]